MIKIITAFIGILTMELFACTAWIVAPDTTTDGNYMIHKTRDWGDGAEVDVTLQFMTVPEGKYKVLAFSPYMMYNEKGLGMFDTALPKTTDYPPEGTPIQNIGSTLAKVCFFCATVQEALFKMIQMTQDGSFPKSENYVLCDATSAVIVEISPKHIGYRFIDRGTAVHTNHFILPEMAYLSNGTVDASNKSAIRLNVTTGQLTDKIKDHQKITLADSVDVARFEDEKYPNMCPFRDSTVCSADYIPNAQYPNILGTLNICPGPTCYAVAIPIPMGIQKIPAILEDGTLGRLAYNIKRKNPDKQALLKLYNPLEEKFRQEYKDAHNKAYQLLKENKKEEALQLLQNVTDKQVAEAFSLMQKVLAE